MYILTAATLTLRQCIVLRALLLLIVRVRHNVRYPGLVNRDTLLQGTDSSETRCSTLLYSALRNNVSSAGPGGVADMRGTTCECTPACTESLHQHSTRCAFGWLVEGRQSQPSRIHDLGSQLTLHSSMQNSASCAS